MNDKKLIFHCCKIAVVLSFIIAFVMAVIMSIWNWLENPNGIFHNSIETNWSFVYETFVSWFIPALLYSFVLLSISTYCYKMLRKSK
ncbi:MAG: hypothetical protein AB8B80_02410 [Marinicellaceae bacterium]